jgi:hypothetical protein
MKTFSFRNFLNEEALDKALSPNVRSAIIDKGGKIYQIGGVVRDETTSKNLEKLLNHLEKLILSENLLEYSSLNPKVLLKRLTYPYQELMKRVQEKVTRILRLN